MPSDLFDSVTKIWRGPMHAYGSPYNPYIGMGQALLYALERDPQKIAQISEDYGSVLTFGDLRVRSIRVAENLKKLGYKQGDRFSIISRNNPDVAPVVFGCFLMGAPISTMDVSFDKSDLVHMLALVEPKIIFCDVIIHETVKLAISELNLKTVVMVFDDKIDTQISSLLKPVEAEHDFEYFPATVKNPTTDTALIMSSSGTTGSSKAICLTHSQLISEMARIWDWSVNASDIMMSFSSLYWISGVGTLLVGTFKGATRLITTKSFDPMEFAKIVKKHKVTQCFLPPSSIAQVMHFKEMQFQDLSSLRNVVVAGSFLLETLRSSFEEKLSKGARVTICYGMTEISNCATSNFPLMKPHSVGRIYYQSRLKVVDDDGVSLGPNQEGELLIKPPFPFVGYLNDDAKTSEFVDEDGWVHSGDLGYVDDDGFIFLKGRKKEIFKYRNFPVSPESIELILQEKTGIAHICVVGIEDTANGTDLPAALIKRPANWHFSEKDIIELANNHLTDVKKLRGGIFFTDEIPITPSGKLRRRSCREMVYRLYNEQKAE